MKHTKDRLELVVKDCYSVAQVLKRLNISYSGGNHAHIKSRLVKFGIDVSHFKGQGHNKGKILKRKLPTEILVLRDKSKHREKGSRLRRAMLSSGVSNSCADCGIGPNWNEKPLCLVPDHKDGKFWNCVLDNLRLLCPNCHSQNTYI